MEGTHISMAVALIICLLADISGLAKGTNLKSDVSKTEDTSVQLPITFLPDYVEGLVVNDIATVQVHINLTDDLPGFANTEHGDPITLKVEPRDKRIITVVGNNTVVLGESSASGGNCQFCANFTVQGLFLGRTTLGFQVNQGASSNASYNTSEDELWTDVPDAYKVSVVREDRIVDKIFIGLVMIMVVLANIGMGCKVEIEVVKEVLRRPFAPAIGFCCQYIIMPLMSFGMAKTFGLTGGLALGFFATGCSPAGGSSNMYTYLLGGDVSLSVTMTLISVIASLGMMPLWLFSLGRFLLDSRVKIPFQNIFYTLLSIMVPIGLGLLIKHKRPKWAKLITKCLRPAYIVLLLTMFTFGVWTNLYIFKLISPMLILASCCLPYSSFLLAGLVAFIFRQPKNRILTIAIETAIQNTGIPILIMKMSMTQPEADLSAVSPVSIACFTPIPLWIAVAYVEIRKRCCGGDKKGDAEAIPNSPEDEEDTEPDIKANGAPVEGKDEQNSDDVKMFPLDDTIATPECKEALLANENHNV